MHEDGFNSQYRTSPKTILARSDHSIVRAGQVIVLNNEHVRFEAVADDGFDSDVSSVMGIAGWAGFENEAPGLVVIPNTVRPTWALPLVGGGNLPNVGTNYIDSWLMRTDVLRTYVSTGRCPVLANDTVDPLPADYIDAALDFIAMEVCRTTMMLLQKVPESSGDLRYALASIMDMNRPSESDLTNAIRGVIASAHIWSIPDQVQSISYEGLPTTEVLAEALQCSEPTLYRIRKSAGLPKIKPGQPFTKSDIDRMICACAETNRTKYIPALLPWSSNPTKPRTKS